ncbi:MAG: hypothetical protein IPM46_04190 [Flavobacteriales bacterium]|nr:hypothetical protein [Flavobacteriales bacterium]
MLRRSISSLRWYLVNMALYVAGFRRRTARRGPVALIDVRDNLWHRYLHILVVFLQVKGFQVHVRHRFSFVGCWASNIMFRWNPTFAFYRKASRFPTESWLITDQDTDRPHFRLDADYFDLPGTSEEGIRGPMPMMDAQYLVSVRALDQQRERKRERGLFFFGNMEPQAYDRDEPERVFGCFSRTHTLNVLRQRMPERIHWPTRSDEITTRPGQPIVLVPRSEMYISTVDVIHILRGFDFFLAPSGVVMPLCHNVVEAIFAGSIPILQYGHLFDPPLRDGVECIAYRTEDDLVAAVERALSMPQHDIDRMRASMQAYYDSHLTIDHVMGRMQKAWPGRIRLRLNGEYISVMMLRAKLDAAGIEGPLPFPEER